MLLFLGAFHMNLKCAHGKRYWCRTCRPYLFCKHNKRRNACINCAGSQICIHKIQFSTCALCGGGSVCVHRRQVSSCRSCNLLAWARRLLTQSKSQAKKFGYAAPKITAAQIVILVQTSERCRGCEESLEWKNGEAPCLHHNHETGQVVGFVHRGCNRIEGFFQKLNSKKQINILKNFFPDVVTALAESM